MLRLLNQNSSNNGLVFRKCVVRRPTVFCHVILILSSAFSISAEIGALGTDYGSSDTVLTTSSATTDEELLTLTQQAAFRYFWDFAHPVSGLAREGYLHGRNLCTTGGTGMGMMTIVVGVERGFVSRADAATHILKMLTFLEEKATRYHGAWSHWLNGNTGQTVKFSTYDDGGDLVETAFLIEGMLTVRQYFDNDNPVENEIRQRVTLMWEQVEWDWYRQYPDSEVLYWHWSPNYGWIKNMAIKGYHEAMIVYILAIASPTHPVPASSYYNGWASKNSYSNGKEFYDYRQWVGRDYGGPLFFTHYSFLGLDPRNKRDNYCNYFENSRNIALIHQAYCIDNPLGHIGYSANCWGLTASTSPFGYGAWSPTNDNGTITPAAAISSMPYTPDESIAALRYFYDNLGVDLWGTYGFRDAFNLTENPDWYSGTWLAIDQGTIAPMIENFRTGMCWDMFMLNTEIPQALEYIGWAMRANAGLIVKYYEGSWNSVPDFTTMTPLFKETASIPTAKIRNRNDNYGLRFEGYIFIDQAGTYTFYLNSDDGSKLYINEQLVINNDGLHGTRERSGVIDLDNGLQRIVVDYIEVTGGAVLETSYKGPGITKQQIPVNVLYLCDLDGDFNNDCQVNMQDLIYLIENWLSPYDLCE